MKTKRFWYHYNKPESKRQGRNVLTLHYEGKCHLIHSLESHAATETHDRKAQPRCVIRGWSEGVEFLVARDEPDHGGATVDLTHAIIH